MTSRNEEALIGGTTQGLRDISQTVSQESIETAVGRKSFESMRARAALAGFALHTLKDGGSTIFLISRWNRSATLGDLQGVAEFLARVEALNG